MIIIDPVAIGDATCSRSTPATYWDRNGVLRTAGPNELRVTYDPSDLSKPPYALVEPAATNLAIFTEDLGYWSLNGGVVRTLNSMTAPTGSQTADRLDAPGDGAGIYTTFSLEAGQIYTLSAFFEVIPGASNPVIRFGSDSAIGLDGGRDAMVMYFSPFVDGPPPGEYVVASKVEELGDNKYRVFVSFRNVLSAGQVLGVIAYAWSGPASFSMWGFQMVKGTDFSSYIPNPTGSPITRAVDVLGTAPGLLYSNVPEDEPLWVSGNYVKGAKVRDATHVVFEALVDNASGPLTDTSSWLKLGPTNRWAMLDDRNNTQTVANDEIVFVVSPRAISQGVFLGNMDATEVRVSMVDQSFGLVYSEVANQIVSTSGSSFYRWCFNRIRRRSYFLTLKMPVFANPLITIAIRKDGSQAKCGMCMIGPAVDVGLSEYGLSTELKDYSTTTFNVDGTSSTMKRGYSKRMSVDLSVKSELVEGIEEQLISYRQKTVVWIGATFRGDAILCGKYSSFKKVIESYPISKMALQIEGVVS